ncbi:hypothetical protein CTA2_5517 [Colletotrichum tanaceti]|nr:hypothetical protein CTA2_5517 [Colletotrichum tanaceti]
MIVLSVNIELKRMIAPDWTLERRNGSESRPSCVWLNVSGKPMTSAQWLDGATLWAPDAFFGSFHPTAGRKKNLDWESFKSSNTTDETFHFPTFASTCRRNVKY